MALESPFSLPQPPKLDDEAAAAQASGVAQQAPVPAARPGGAGGDSSLCGGQGEMGMERVDGVTRGHLPPADPAPVEIEAQTRAVPALRSPSAASVSPTGETGDEDKGMQEASQGDGESGGNLVGDGAGHMTPEDREDDGLASSHHISCMGSAIAFGGYLADCL